MHELRLLGSTECSGTQSGDPAAALAHPKRFALLAYLAAAQPFGWHRRDTLVGLLWPDLDQEHARTALRKTVHRLRTALGSDTFLARGDESIAISPTTLWCDVRAFDAAIAADQAEEALALYRGDFLPGLFVAEAPEFERWVGRERDELRRRAAQVALRASEVAERAGQITQCIDLTRRSAQLAPDDEQAIRRLISLLNRAGDRAGALRIYEGFERHLATELQVTPSSETQSLIAAVRAETPTASKLVSAAPTRPDNSSSPLGFDLAQPDTHADLIEGIPDVSASVANATAIAGSAAGHPSLPAARRKARALWLGMVALPVALAALLIAPRYARVEPTLDDARVAVFALENETNRPDLRFVGMEVQDWITRGLQQTGLVRVVPVDFGTGTGTPNDPRVSPGDERRIATTLGAGTLIRGHYYLRRDSIVLQLSIVGVHDGDVIAALAPVAGSITDPTAAIDRLRQRAIAVLATHVDSALNQWALAASQPPSFEAYRELAEGIKAVNRDDYSGAVGHYLRAAALDSGYVLPLLKAAELRGAPLNDPAGADSLLRAARRRSSAFTPFDEAFASGLEAGLAHDFERVFDEAQRLRQYVTPGSEYDLNTVAAAVAINRPREAVEIVKGIDLHRRPILDHWDAFVPITNAYHLAGENEALLAILRKDAVAWRHIPLVVVDEMEALAGLSRPAEAAIVWRRLLRARGDDAVAGAMWAAWNGARELRAHGFAVAARALAAEALDSFPTVPTHSVHFGDPLALQRDLLREAGRPREALAVAHAVVAKHPRRVWPRVVAAVAAAQLGDSSAARRLDARLADSVGTADRTGLLLARAELAAALGMSDSAVRRLRELCERGCLIFEDLHIIFEFDSLRSYPPFQELLRPRQ